MKRNAFVALLALTLGLVASTPALAQGAKRKKAPEKRPLLQAFVVDQTRFQANYTGVDERLFFDVFKKQLGALTKRKSESDEQFVARAADTESVLRPISTKTAYAFLIPGLAASYNPARQVFVFGGKHGYGCQASGFLDGHVTCGIREHPLQAESTDGGAAGTSQNAVHEIHGLAIPVDSLFVQDSFKLDRNKFYFHRELPVAEEKARELHGATLSVLFVGKVTEGRFVNARGEKLLPVVKRAHGATALEYDVPFQVDRIVFYVQQTGEILHQVVF